MIPVEELNSGWQGGHVMYPFTDKYSLRLDEMSNAFQSYLTGLNEETSEDSESDDEHEQQTDVHEVELTAMQHRRRVVRNAEGQILTSYRDFSNPRFTRERQWRVQNLGQEETESQAERNSPEFEHSETD